MKKVVSPETVAHLWANQSQSEATNSNRSLFFEGDTIYSYGRHFAIAKHVVNSEGERTTLFTTRTYSVTTAKHINTVRHAVNHKDLIFCAYPDELFRNLDAFLSEGESIARKLQKARLPEKYLSELSSLKHTVDKYCTFFKIDVAKDKAELLTLLSIGDKSEYLQYAESKAKIEREREIKAQKEATKKIKKELKEFRDFERPTLYTRNGFDYLRYNSQLDRIQTSQGVEIPINEAKVFYNLILSTNQKGGCTDCNTKLLNRYEVNEINKDFIKVGCHTIALKEVQSIAKQLNWQ